MNRELGIPLNTLAPGSTFWIRADRPVDIGEAEWRRLNDPTTPEEHRVEGTLIHYNESRARVKLEDGTEYWWASTSEVHPLRDSGRSDRHHGGTRIGDMKAQETGLRARFTHQTAAFQKAAEAGDAERMEIVGKRLDALKEEAAKANIDLETTAEVEGTTAEVGGKSAEEGPMAQDEKVVEEKAKKVRAVKTVGGEQVAEKKAVKVERLCIVTGKPTGGLFSPGADAKAKSLMLQVERGVFEGGKAAFAKQYPKLASLVKFAGRESTAGKDGSDFRIVQSPVKFPGREDVAVLAAKDCLAMLDKAAAAPAK